MDCNYNVVLLWTYGLFTQKNFRDKKDFHDALVPFQWWIKQLLLWFREHYDNFGITGDIGYVVCKLKMPPEWEPTLWTFKHQDDAIHFAERVKNSIPGDWLYYKVMADPNKIWNRFHCKPESDTIDYQVFVYKAIMNGSTGE